MMIAALFLTQLREGGAQVLAPRKPTMAEVSEPSLLLTLRWREMDSNFRFRVRCKRGLRRKSPASAACSPSIICG
jgi:hypothetical protein